MQIAVEKVGDVAVAAVPVEELDASNAGEFKRDMTPVLDVNAKLVLDLSRLRFVDSSGLGAFISCLRKLNAKGGDLKLCGMSKQVRGVFELVRMHRVFDILGSREDAVHAFAHLAASRPDVPDRAGRRSPPRRVTSTSTAARYEPLDCLRAAARGTSGARQRRTRPPRRGRTARPPAGTRTRIRARTRSRTARAHVHGLEADEWDPHPFVSPEFVRALAASEAPGARVIIGPWMESKNLPALLPPHATVVLSGPIRHFLESPEQRLGRQLTKAGYDVVFIPCR